VRAWVVFGAALLVLASPVKLVWMRPQLGWLAPFAVWLALIIAAARRRGD
jgi:hypothetical protein